jgi:uncharacterized membrane protein
MAGFLRPFTLVRDTEGVTMLRKLFWTSGAALMGAGLMALFDPNRGRTRRATLRNRATGAAGAVGSAAGKTWRDLRHRAEGAAARGRSVFARAAGADGVLVARVRSRIGRLTSHPRAIGVEAEDGRVVLSGPVLASEAETLVAGARSVPGVESVEDRLERFERADGVPALQGPARRVSRRLLRQNWSPTARLVGGAAGAALAVAGARRRDWIGGGMAIVGLGVLTRAATNRPVKRMLRVRGSRAHVDVRKSIAIEAPVSGVYEFWRHWENFPRFFEHVRAVRDEGGGWTRWTVSGPGDPAVEFDAVLTATIPNYLIAWKTAPRQALRHSGIVKFDAISPSVTGVEVHMTYDPPAGRLGQALTALLGVDPGSTLENDLLRLKTLLEGATGRSGREGALREPETSAAAPAGSAEEALRVPAAEAVPATRDEAPVPKAEEAIVAAQDAGAAPLIQEEPGQAEPYDESAGTARKTARKRTRRKRGEETDQPL